MKDIEHFQYKMTQKCEEQNKPCEFCDYYYKYINYNGEYIKRCFLNELQRFISYKIGEHD